MKKSILFLSVFILIINACTKEEVIPRPYSRVNTIGISNVSNSGATFSGEIFYAGAPIVDHGFLWSPYASVPFAQSDRISLGPMTGTGKFEGSCTWGLQKGIVYYMRAYSVSGGHEVYGDIEQFSGLGSPAPVITDIYPTLVTWGDTVTLIGDNFSSVGATNIVHIHDSYADIIRGNRDTLWVKVAYYFINEYNDVTVVRPTDVAKAPKQLQLKGPEITSISPVTGSAGTQVTITGNYLATSQANVYFNDTAAPLTNLTSTSLIVNVPEGLSPGDVIIKVVTGNGGLNDTATFKIIL